mgnify:CR=1 FL=1
MRELVPRKNRNAERCDEREKTENVTCNNKTKVLTRLETLPGLITDLLTTVY